MLLLWIQLYHLTRLITVHTVGVVSVLSSLYYMYCSRSYSTAVCLHTCFSSRKRFIPLSSMERSSSYSPKRRSNSLPVLWCRRYSCRSVFFLWKQNIEPCSPFCLARSFSQDKARSLSLPLSLLLSHLLYGSGSRHSGEPTTRLELLPQHIMLLSVHSYLERIVLGSTILDLALPLP